MNPFEKRRKSIHKMHNFTLGKSFSSEEEATKGLNAFFDAFPIHCDPKSKDFSIGMMPVPPPNVDAIYKGNDKQIIKDFQAFFSTYEVPKADKSNHFTVILGGKN